MIFTRDLYEIAVVVESARKTAETPADGDWMELLEGVVNEVYTKKENEQRHGMMHHSDSDRLISIDYNAPMKALIDRHHFPKFVYAILGLQDTDTDSPEAGVNTHEFTRADTNLLPLLTIVSKNPTEDEVRYAGYGPSKLELSFVKDDFLQYSVEGNGLKKDDPGSLSPGYEALNSEFVPWMCVIRVAADVSGLNAADDIEVGELTLTLERSNTPYHGIGDGDPEPSEIIAQKLKVSGSVTKLFENLTYKTWADTDNDYRAVQIRLIDTENTIGAATHPSIFITLPRVSARNHAKDNTDEHTNETFDLLANLDKEEGDILVTIVNEDPAFNTGPS